MSVSINLLNRERTAPPGWGEGTDFGPWTWDLGLYKGPLENLHVGLERLGREQAEREAEEGRERRRVPTAEHVAVGALEDRRALLEEPAVDRLGRHPPRQAALVVEPAVAG